VSEKFPSHFLILAVRSSESEESELSEALVFECC
jgi:hypothetical protein